MRKIMNTKGAVRRMNYGSCLLLLLVLFSCTSIDETLPECQLYVRFRYDYNMEFSDAFAAQVNRIHVTNAAAAPTEVVNAAVIAA